VRVVEISQGRPSAVAPRDAAVRLFSLEEPGRRRWPGTALRLLADVDPSVPLDLMLPQPPPPLPPLPAPSSPGFARMVRDAYAGCGATWYRNVSDGHDVTTAPGYLRNKDATLYVALEGGRERAATAATPQEGRVSAMIYVHAAGGRRGDAEEVNWVCKPEPSSPVRMHRLLSAILTLRLLENPRLMRFELDAVGSERAKPLYERVGFVARSAGDEDEMVLHRETLLGEEEAGEEAGEEGTPSEAKASEEAEAEEQGEEEEETALPPSGGLL
jgi:hypothetical protein